MRFIEPTARAAILLLPLALLTSRSLTEILIGLTDALFLAAVTAQRARPDLPRLLVVTTLSWWAWLILASAIQWPVSGPHALTQAILAGRFFLLVAALTHLLRTHPARDTLTLAVTAAAAWIALECWQQVLLGTDIFGWPRYPDGALTGPFQGPKAGPALILILFPALLPPVLALLRRRTPRATAAAFLLAAAGIAIMVLIGQRMPALLTLLGLLTCALLLRPVRPVLLATAAAGVLLLAATPLISPPTFAKLVVHFRDQMSHFPSSAYGQLYTRATVMTASHPWLGLGFDGFRSHCAEAQYRHGLPLLGIPDQVADGRDACNIHPHNHYLEAATEGGLPGLLLFTAAVVAALAALGRNLLAVGATGRRVGLFTSFLLALWPLASTSALFTVPNAGWTFLLLGWGLAEARHP